MCVFLSCLCVYSGRIDFTLRHGDLTAKSWANRDHSTHEGLNYQMGISWHIIWLVVSTILKNTSQWEGLSHILWNIKKSADPGRQQGGARQGREVVNTQTIHNNNNPPTPADSKGERVRAERLWTQKPSTTTTTGRNFDAFPSFTAMVFSHPGAVFWTGGVAKAGAAAAGGKSIAKIILFYGFQKLH